LRVLPFNVCYHFTFWFAVLTLQLLTLPCVACLSDIRILLLLTLDDFFASLDCTPLHTCAFAFRYGLPVNLACVRTEEVDWMNGHFFFMLNEVTVVD